MINVINVRDLKRLEIEKDDERFVYVGRPMGKGSHWLCRKGSILGNYVGSGMPREKSIEAFRRWLWAKIKGNDSEVLEELKGLCNLSKKGDLYIVCWCKPKACHGDVIKSCLEWILKQ